MLGSAVVIALWSVGVNGLLGEGMKKSKPVVGSLEIALCATLKSAI